MRKNEWEKITEIFQDAIQRLGLSKEEVLEKSNKIKEEKLKC